MEPVQSYLAPAHAGGSGCGKLNFLHKSKNKIITFLYFIINDLNYYFKFIDQISFLIKFLNYDY